MKVYITRASRDWREPEPSPTQGAELILRTPTPAHGNYEREAKVEHPVWTLDVDGLEHALRLHERVIVERADGSWDPDLPTLTIYDYYVE